MITAPLVFALGYVAGARYFGERMSEWRNLTDENNRLRETVSEQGQQVANLELADRVNKMAEEKLRQQLAALQTEQVDLENDLNLYRNLVEDDSDPVGFTLESFSVRKGDQPNRFVYDMVLRRKDVLSQAVDFAVSLELKGELHGIPFSAGYKEVDPNVNSDVVSVSIKYFRVIQGVLELPDHFSPANVVISIYQEGKADSLLIKEFPWRIGES